MRTERATACFESRRPAASAGLWWVSRRSLRETKRFRAFLEGLPGGHRTATGPLTTSEAAKDEALRQTSLAKDDERIKHKREDADQESDSTSS